MTELDLDNYLAEFRQIASEQGFAETVLAQIEGDPLSVWQPVQHNPDLPCIYLSAGIHGDEPAGTLALLDLLRQGTLSTTVNCILFPALNPTGLRAGTRTNANGVDLNRDYHTCLTKEVSAHVRWLRNNPKHYDLTLSLHEDWETSGFYLYEIITAQAPSIATTILDAVSAVIPLEPQGTIDNHPMQADGLIHHESTPDEPEGWPEAIFHVRISPSRSYTFETPSSLPIARRRLAQMVAVRTAIEEIG